MSGMRVVWSDHAISRIKEQAQYIATESGFAEAAANWANKIFDAGDGIADFPESGRRLPEFPSSPYREIIVMGNYRIVYRIDGRQCLIVTVRRVSMEMTERDICSWA